MKKYTTIFAIAAAVATVASCDLNKTPVFDAADSFAAFDKTSVTVDENCGKVTLPVTIASIDPVKTTVSYEVVEVSAKENTNFSLADDSAVLTFDGKTRSQEIVINIVNFKGFTGDLTFQVKLVSAKGLKLGDSSVCTVKISDLDHPLADILGTYTITSDSNWDGVVTYQGSIVKDDNDISACWVIGIANNPFNTAKYAVAGKVSEDHSTITIPLGQQFSYNSSYNTKLYGCDGDYLYDGTGDIKAIVLTKDENGDFVSNDLAAAFPALKVSDGSSAGYFEIMLPPTKFHKN